MKHLHALTLLAAGSALVLGISACNRADRTDPEKTALAEGPLTYEATTPYADVSLKLPEAIRGFPLLYRELYDAEVGDLKDYAEGAQADRSEFGGTDFPPYEKAITFAAPVETGRLFSMVRTDFDFSGGAHPNTVATGLLWDKGERKQISARDLFAPGTDLAPVSQALCDAVNVAKKARPGSKPVTETSETWTCPDLSQTAVVLARSEMPTKASGLTFLINAYMVGPYVEGAYYITLPFDTVRPAINPAYLDDFGGTGTTGDVTNSLIPQ